MKLSARGVRSFLTEASSSFLISFKTAYFILSVSEDSGLLIDFPADFTLPMKFVKIYSISSTSIFNKSGFKVIVGTWSHGRVGGSTPILINALSRTKAYFWAISSGIGMEKNKPKDQVCLLSRILIRLINGSSSMVD